MARHRPAGMATHVLVLPRRGGYPLEEARLGLFGDHKPADTVVGIETLARPEYLIEVDAVAVTGG